MGKEAAHGFRNLSVIKIPVGFEQPITELKTNCDKTINTAILPSIWNFHRKPPEKRACHFAHT